MNGSEMKKFKALLEKALLELDKGDALGSVGQRVVMLDQQAVGRLSRMDALQNQAMAQAQASRRQVERLRINAALERVEDGEFGYCEACGEAIPIPRLELDPCAVKCADCASG